MATNFVDQITGGGETVAQKAPCRLATTGNIALTGHQTIDGQLTVDNDRVLVRLNADQTQNGIWIAAAGAWTRARDFDSNRDITKGTRVTVTDGSTLAGKEYQISSSNPITVGSSNITFIETLSSDAGSSAAAAAASAGAAAISETNAGNSESAAAGSASAASTSAANAATSASTAGTAATNAGNSATSASGSASTASTAATNAGNSESAAAGSASAASTSAGNAATSETNAGSSATAAAASASAAANSVAALAYAFSTTTTDADPGAGIFRLNNATVASATAAFIDNVDADAVTVTSILDSWDDASATVKGTLTIRSKANAAIRHTFSVSGSVVDGTGYRKLTLAYVGGAGTLTNTMPCWLVFLRSGNDGAGTGDVVGPAGATDSHFAQFNGTTGKLLKGGKAAPSGVVVGTTDAQTLTNKTLTAPAISSPTGIVKGDVGLGSVDNTSDATKNAAAVSLTNKTYVDPVIQGSITEDVFTISDGAGFAIDPRNGSIQFITLGASRTPVAANWNDGEAVTLRIADGTAFTITWTTVGVVWKGGTAPTLATSGYTEVNLEKSGGVIRGVYVGDFAS